MCQYKRRRLYIIYVVMYMKALKEKISITIDGDILERIREEAERDDRSLSQYINLVLRKHLQKESDSENGQ